LYGPLALTVHQQKHISEDRDRRMYLQILLQRRSFILWRIIHSDVWQRRSKSNAISGPETVPQLLEWL
jgi:hypothetical protein